MNVFPPDVQKIIDFAGIEIIFAEPPTTEKVIFDKDELINLFYQIGVSFGQKIRFLTDWKKSLDEGTNEDEKIHFSIIEKQVLNDWENSLNGRKNGAEKNNFPIHEE